MRYSVSINLQVEVESESIPKFYANFSYWLKTELQGLGDDYQTKNVTLKSALVTNLNPLPPNGTQEVLPLPHTDSDIALTPEEEAAADLPF